MRHSLNFAAARWTLLLVVMSAPLLHTSCAPKESAAAGPVEAPFRAIDFATARTQAQSEGKLVFVDLWAPWCGPCKLLDSTTWKDEGVRELLASTAVPIKVNVDDHSDIANQFKVEGIPTLLVLRPDGTEVSRVVGYVDASQFRARFSEVLTAKP